MYSKFFKRSFDLILVLLAILIFSPLFATIAFLIKFFDNGPVFFISKRVGKNGQLFDLYKFRSMPISTPLYSSKIIKDVELTKLGKFIRRSNLDELPQLLNILKGDMSIVGPRPSLKSQDELNTLRKLNGSILCLPGLTGLAQINSYDNMSDNVKASFDFEYAKKITFLNDLKIIILTFSYLFRPPPTY